MLTLYNFKISDMNSSINTLVRYTKYTFYRIHLTFTALASYRLGR